MTLEVTVLGGSAAWPNPAQGCSAYLFASGDTRVLADCGPNTLLELRAQTDYTSIDGIIISHCHSDHILDLVPYRYGLVYGPVALPRRIPVWLPPGGIKRMMLLAEAFGGQGEHPSDFWGQVFDLREYDADDALEIGALGVRLAPTQHFIPCFGIRCEDASGAAIAYTSDTGSIEPLIDRFSGVSAIIAEATLRDHAGKPLRERGHLTPDDAGELATRVQAKTLVLTHLWCERPDDEVVMMAGTRFDGEILVAKPGLRVQS